jgi:rRNA-processing protein FCF1
MKKRVLLDTSFIVTCVKQKIDFFSELKDLGMEIIIPEQVIQELHSVKENKSKKLESKDAAKTALRIIKKSDYLPLLFEGSYVDSEIIKYARINPEIIIATLDRGIKKKLKNKNRLMVIRQKKKLEII